MKSSEMGGCPTNRCIIAIPEGERLEMIHNMEPESYGGGPPDGTRFNMLDGMGRR